MSEVILESFQEAALLPKEGSCKWKPCSQGILRLDVDFAFRREDNRAGVGFIFRDHIGMIVAAVSRPIGFQETVLLGELHAMLLAVGFCLEHDLGLVHVFTDSLLAVHVLSEANHGSDSLCDDLYEDFMQAKRHVMLDVSHARREANAAAHSLANYALVNQSVMIWKSDFPSWLHDIVLADVN